MTLVVWRIRWNITNNLSIWTIHYQNSSCHEINDQILMTELIHRIVRQINLFWFTFYTAQMCGEFFFSFGNVMDIKPNAINLKIRLVNNERLWNQFRSSMYIVFSQVYRFIFNMTLAVFLFSRIETKLNPFVLQTFVLLLRT